MKRSPPSFCKDITLYFYNIPITYLRLIIFTPVSEKCLDFFFSFPLQEDADQCILQLTMSECDKRSSDKTFNCGELKVADETNSQLFSQNILTTKVQRSERH